MLGSVSIAMKVPSFTLIPFCVSYNITSWGSFKSFGNSGDS